MWISNISKFREIFSKFVVFSRKFVVFFSKIYSIFSKIREMLTKMSISMELHDDNILGKYTQHCAGFPNSVVNNDATDNDSVMVSFISWLFITKRVYQYSI